MRSESMPPAEDTNFTTQLAHIPKIGFPFFPEAWFSDIECALQVYNEFTLCIFSYACYVWRFLVTVMSRHKVLRVSLALTLRSRDFAMSANTSLKSCTHTSFESWNLNVTCDIILMHAYLILFVHIYMFMYGFGPLWQKQRLQNHALLNGMLFPYKQ